MKKIYSVGKPNIVVFKSKDKIQMLQGAENRDSLLDSLRLIKHHCHFLLALRREVKL